MLWIIWAIYLHVLFVKVHRERLFAFHLYPRPVFQIEIDTDISALTTR